ncbi:3-oxoacyl-[acyl-carrier-protein] synthase III C-terminal domain-containing protein [Kitasatospora sp. NPDC085895]|uniref:3-oxoacyl-ACP synthase III family protein n=1 Tax=Kitasatospora sp. NPDC085895 TaxID=3155057 RepID=UPI00344CC642
MKFENIGIVGTGIWEGPTVSNSDFSRYYPGCHRLSDPLRGDVSVEGTVQLAGKVLDPAKFPQTVKILKETIGDPFRGARERLILPNGVKSSEIETAAARRALSDAGIEPGDVDFLLVQSFLPDEIQPHNAALVAHKVGITRAPSWNIDTLCNSAITHMLVASSLIASGVAKNVLCVQSTAYSKVFDMTESVARTVGDGASAFVIGKSKGASITGAWRTDGSLYPGITLKYASSGNMGVPLPNPRVMFDRQSGVEVVAALEKYSRLVCGAVIEDFGVVYSGIDAFICNQNTVWMPSYTSEIIGIPTEKLFHTYKEYGNVNGVGLAASLHHARKGGRLTAGSKVLVFGAAGGFTAGAVLLES